jgi:hypothetical protein
VLDLLLLCLLLLLLLLLWFCPVFDIQRERTTFKKEGRRERALGIVLFLLLRKKISIFKVSKIPSTDHKNPFSLQQNYYNNKQVVKKGADPSTTMPSVRTLL